MADVSRLPGPNADLWDWQLDGACRGTDTALFFHPEGERGPARAAPGSRRQGGLRRVPGHRRVPRPRPARARAVRRLGRDVRGRPRGRRTAPAGGSHAVCLSRPHRPTRDAGRPRTPADGSGAVSACALRSVAVATGAVRVAVPAAVRRGPRPRASRRPASRSSAASPRWTPRCSQRRAGDLDRVDDAGSDEVDVLAGRGVEAVPDRQRARPWRRRRSPRGRRSRRSSAAARQPHGARSRHRSPRRPSSPRPPSSTDGRVHEGGAAAGDDALLDRGAGRRDGVLDAVLLLLELDLGVRADLDDADAAGELGEPLLELLAVPVGVGALDLGAELARRGRPPASASPPPSMIVVSSLVTTTRRAVPSTSRPTWSSLSPTSGATTCAPVRMAMSSSIALRRSPKPGALTRDRGEEAADLVDHQGGQRLAVDVLGDDQQRLGRPGRPSRAAAAGRRPSEILPWCEQDVGVLEDGLHALGVGDEVRG